MASASPNSNSTQGASSNVARAAAARRDMKNFSDLEINDLLSLIPDEYTAEQQAAEEAAATAAAIAASASGKGVHHTVTYNNAGVPWRDESVDSRQSSSSNAKGRQQQGGITDDDGFSNPKTQDTDTEAQETQLKSERKRSREKQRRNDVNKQFAHLTEVLKKVEREAHEMGRYDDAYGSVSTMMAIAASTGPTNRVDLIARTIVHLERLNRTAKKQRLDIENLQEQIKRTKKAGEDMAEKLKDVMFNQQRPFNTAAYAPFPRLATSATAASGMSPMTATTGVPQQKLRHQMPMMVMPLMMPQSTVQCPSPMGAPIGATGPTTAPGGAHVQQQQQQQQQQFMMVIHPGGEMAQTSMQQMMQPMALIQQQPQSTDQQPHSVHQVHQQAQHTYVQQQQPMQRQHTIAPSNQAPPGQGSSNGGCGPSDGENFAHAA